ncbi:hypothetical protein IWW49_005912 [Coemansia sp. RSA 1797]|nr:hypothetical protein IWW49_005912 [Coemansia sp. RSA 1797]
MQQKSPLGSTRASGVLDRVRWIEKTHGPDTTQQAPRTRLKLPKQFAEAQAEPTPMMKPSELKPTIRSVEPAPRCVDEMPSPALSETSTAYAKSPAAPPMRVPETVSSPKPSHPAPKPSHSTLVPVAPKMAKSATLGHMASHVAQPHASSYDDDMLYKNGYSSSSDIDVADPVHVGTRVDASEPVLSATKTLGGVRSRTRAARSRRFEKSQQATSNTSVHSNESEHEPHAPPTLRSSQSLTNMRAEYDEESPSSLLARLATRTANRPNVQDLVSNRSGPKFVKRSHHYNASPFKNESPALSFSNTWARSERRFK